MVDDFIFIFARPGIYIAPMPTKDMIKDFD
jgi:hypothetical protein